MPVQTSHLGATLYPVPFGRFAGYTPPPVDNQREMSHPPATFPAHPEGWGWRWWARDKSDKSLNCDGPTRLFRGAAPAVAELRAPRQSCGAGRASPTASSCCRGANPTRETRRTQSVPRQGLRDGRHDPDREQLFLRCGAGGWTSAERRVRTAGTHATAGPTGKHATAGRTPRQGRSPRHGRGHAPRQGRRHARHGGVAAGAHPRGVRRRGRGRSRPGGSRRRRRW